MAKEFPQADVIGMDIVTPDVMKRNPQDVPENCSFDLGDAESDMDRYRDIAVMHVRCAHSGFRDFHKWLNDAAKCLRPGGVILLVAALPVRVHLLSNGFRTNI